MQNTLGKASFVQLDCTQHLPLVQMDFPLITSSYPSKNGLPLPNIIFSLFKKQSKKLNHETQSSAHHLVIAQKELRKTYLRNVILHMDFPL